MSGPAECAVLLWPGLGFGGAYFSEFAELLPARAIAVDPPGWGRSPPLPRYSYDALVERAGAELRAHRCNAILGHSIGGDIALGVAAAPPATLRAVVLVDGGYLEPSERAQLGVPAGADREALIAFCEESEARFPDWETMLREMGAMLGVDRLTPAIETILREGFKEVDGEIREAAPPERCADMLMPFVTHDFGVGTRAAAIAVPTLLVACGRPPEVRTIKQQAWERFAQLSALIELCVAEDWNHHAILEAPEAVAKLVGDWLRAHI